MSTDRWQVLSEWHNAWLAAGAGERERLEAELARDHPDLVAESRVLAESSDALAGFLETPALALWGRDLAHDDSLLETGTRVGPYSVAGLLARGGMSDVYRATDVRLRRDVALKVMAAAAGDTQRVERFLQEGRVAASLDHVNIIKVFDVGLLEGRPYLVTELLEGETLRACIGRGPLSAGNAARVARDIALGLVVAHGAGLVHRDLKPDNIFLTRTRRTTILDFGIAKLIERRNGLDALATAAGVLLGTASYLAPEQIRGDAVDGRTDLFALGAMLFEMVTGQRAFAREHMTDTLHAILHDAPAALPPQTPPELAAIIVRLLEKDPGDRFQSAADLAWALESQLTRPIAARAGVALQPEPARAFPWRTAAAVAIVVGLAAMALVYRSPAVSTSPPPDATSVARSAPATRPETVHFEVSTPPATRFEHDVERTHLALSPDGAQIAFIARSADGSRVWLRAIASIDASPVGGTDGATSVFWSPDGKSLAFFAGNRLKRVDLPGGAAVSVCEVAERIGLTGTWGTNGDILFGSVEGDAIMRVSLHGGAPSALVTARRSDGEARVHWPWFLPDGRRFLYLSRLRDGSGHVMLGEPGVPSRRVLPAVSNVQWVDPDYLVFVRDGILVGQRFDLASGRIAGGPFSIASTVAYNYSTGRGEFATSRTGHLAYQPHADSERLVWSDRRGVTNGVVGSRGNYQSVRLSPDGGRVLFDRLDAQLGTPDVWVLDLARGIETRITAQATSESFPVWLKGGLGTVFMADRDGPPRLVRADLVRGGDEALLPTGRMQQPVDVSPDGRTLAFQQRTPLGNFDVVMMALDAPGAPTARIDSRFDEIQLRFSLDGRAVAFLSDESGQYEAYVAPWPALTPRIRVSTQGASLPRWNPRRPELLYLSTGGSMMAVNVRTTPTLGLDMPVELFAISERATWRDFAVSASGQRFLAIVADSRADEQPLTVVLNWPTALAR